MELRKAFGLTEYGENEVPKIKRLKQYISLKLAALGQPIYVGDSDDKFLDYATDLIKNYKEKNRLLSDYLCPADQRIQDFIDSYLREYKEKINIRIPSNTFTIDSHGIARMMSSSAESSEFKSDIIYSYKIKQGFFTILKMIEEQQWVYFI
jgi:hypothetical protein